MSVMVEPALGVLGRTGQGERVEAHVIARTEPMGGAVELVVHAPAAARACRPGQFFQIAVDAPRTLLRRPYSAAWTDPPTGQLGFIFNVVGAGSAWLAARKAGDRIDLLGPLGRGFDLSAEGPVVCVAGGLGIAVFPGVVAVLVKQRRRVMFLCGARTAGQLLPSERFSGAEVRVATDDGSTGHHGTVVDLLAAILPPTLAGEGRGGSVEILTCGPTPMLRELVQQTSHFNLPLSSIQVALETPMGCGVGTCLGCVAPASGGSYLLTCTDGPCVRGDRVDWSRITDAFHG